MTDHYVEKLPGYRHHKFLSAGQICSRWGMRPETVERLAEEYGWSIRRDSTTGWRDAYREDHVERTMQILGTPE